MQYPVHLNTSTGWINCFHQEIVPPCNDKLLFSHIGSFFNFSVTLDNPQKDTVVSLVVTDFDQRNSPYKISF